MPILIIYRSPPEHRTQGLTPAQPRPDVFGSVNTHSSNNLIGDGTGQTGLTNSNRGNQVGTSGTPVDPLLGTLAHNGGPTKTHMPTSSSPAVDSGTSRLGFQPDTSSRGVGFQPAISTRPLAYYDARREGFLRTAGTTVDIGAVEYHVNELVVDELSNPANRLTLAEAITTANSRPGHDVISFSAGLDLSAAMDISLSAELSITGDLTILGPGADLLAISADESSRVFHLAAGTNVRLVGLTLKDGSATGAGGAIYSAADPLIIEQCQITDSVATGDGGGIDATGILKLLESTVSGNSATSGVGGGMLVEGASAAVTVLQSTVAENSASTNGGGIRIATGYVLLHNTIVADNSASTANPDVYGTLLADSSYNLIADGTGLSGISNGDSGNQIGTGASPIDPKLGPLKDHGGPTKTHSLRVDSPAIDAGSDRGVSILLANPPGASILLANSAAGLLSVTHLGRTSSIEYDMLGRTAQVTQVDLDGIGSASTPTVTYSYDANGNLLSETDSLGNATSHSYDNLGRKIQTTDAEAGVTEFTYDAVGRMTSLTDPEGNTTSWTFDPLGHVATETITVSSTDLIRTFGYDAAGNLVRKIDRNDRVTDFSYDLLSRKTSEAWYDDETDTDAEQNVRKTYSTTYDEAGRVASVGDGSYDLEYTYSIFDALGRVTDIVYERATTEFADYDFAWDVAGRLTGFDFTSLVGDDGDADYSYDDTSQLTAADYDFQTDESYTYDENGNRTNTGYTTGDHNRLTSDGTYNYTYDNEGNVTSKTNISTSESIEYTWDHRNPLTKVTFENSSSVATKIVEYAYDHGQRWVRKTLDSNADSTIDESRIFVHDNRQIVLDFEKTGTGDASNTDLSHRYLWGAAVDQILADEVMDDGTADDVHWTLVDHLNSVRDLAEYNPVTDTSSTIKHITYDAFGNITGDSSPAIEGLFLYTARPYDEDTELQNNLNRWHDLSTRRWMSTHPIGFEAGDVNLYRYVGNRATSVVDPSEFQPSESG